MIALAQHPATPAAPAAVRTVSITDLTYTPGALVVAPGTAVRWTNDGRNRHTVTADAGAFGSGTLLPADTFRITVPSTPGVYAYHCTFHSYIRGTLTVSTVSLAAPMAVTVGGRPHLSGTVPDAPAGTVVSVQRRVPGAWEQVATASTDGDGVYSVTGPALSSRTAFRAVSGDSLSPSVRADVQPAVVVTRAGARLAVRVRPAGGGVVHLERLDLDTYRWQMVAERDLSAGRARFTLAAPGVYRAMVQARGGLSEAASRVVQFRPGAFRE